MLGKRRRIDYVDVFDVRAITRTLIGGGGCVYSYIHVLPDRFLFKLINLNLI